MGTQKIHVLWEGPQFVNSSLALVNRYICSELLKRENISLTIIPTQRDSIPQSWVKNYDSLKSCYTREVGHSDVHIRQQWPPILIPSQAKFQIMLQPWEYGTIPQPWVPFISEYVDEVWVNSEYTKNGYLRSGIPEGKVFVFPLGVDFDVFHPIGPRYPLKTNKQFKFLFVGGTIYRKGIDKLLGAYSSVFSNKDNVCLVIKDQGTNTYYRGQTYGDRIRELQQISNAPEILYLDDDLNPLELASLYRACDCLVHPYRGEGFGLPILEAMASGLPPIIPQIGPATEFSDDRTSYRVSADIQTMQLKDLDTVLPAELIDVDINSLGEIMRTVYENQSEVAKRGQEAYQFSKQYSWNNIGDIVAARLENSANHVGAQREHDLLQSFASRVVKRTKEERNLKKEAYTYFLKCFKPGDVILDFGMADDTWMKRLHDYGAICRSMNSIDDTGLLEPEKAYSQVVNLVRTFEGSFDGVTMFHVIEHFSVPQALRLCHEIMGKLTYRGRLLMTTPNYENQVVSNKEFWLDVRRVRPYPLELLYVLLQECGFRTIVCGKSKQDKELIIFASLIADDNPFNSG